MRTGVPPCSRTTSGTAFEQIRLWRIVAPGSFSSTPTATIAVVVEPESRSPCSSTRNTRSASPSNARPMSAPISSTRARRSRWFSGWIGSAGWFGNVPSSSGYMISRSKGSAVEHGGDDEAAHAVGGVGHDLQRPEDGWCRRTSGRGRRTAPRRSCWRTVPGRRRRQSTPAAAIGLDLGEAGVLRRPAWRPARHSLMPLYCGRVVRGGEHRARRVEACRTAK